MMKKLKRSLSIIVCAIFMLALQVHTVLASDEFETIDATQDLESGIVTLTCQLKEGFVSKRISFLILKPGKTAEDIDYGNPSAFLDVVCHFDEKEVDENGKAVFSFSLNEEAQDGNYILSVGGTHVEIANSTAVLNYTNVHDDQKLEQINNATTPDAMRAVITEDFHALDFEGYAKLSISQETKLINKLCDKLSAGGFTSIAEYAECFNAYVAVGLLNDSRDKNEEKAILESRSDVFGLDKDLAVKLGATDVFTAFANVTLEKIFTEPTEVQEEYIDMLLNLCVRNSRWSDLYDRLVLLKNNGADINLSPYEEIMSDEIAAAKAMQAIVGKNVNTETFDATLREAVNAGMQDSAGGNHSSGGGGRDGAGLSAIAVPVSTENEKNGENGEKTEEFIDLDSVPWAKDAVCYLKEQGIVSGKSEGIFDPSAHITREEFVKMLVLSFHIEEDASGTHFSDVYKNNWCYPYIYSAYRAGVINGISEDVFGVGEKLTREQLATIIYRAVDTTENSGDDNSENEGSFKDYNDVSEYAKKAVNELYKRGIISGKDDGMFGPKDFATRAETAKILYEVIKGGR